MKKLATILAAGMMCAVLGAAETQVYKTDFKTQAFAWSQYAKTCKVTKNNSLVTEIVSAAPAGAKVLPTSTQIGVNVPKGLAAGDYRMDCTIAITRDCRENVAVIRNTPPWTSLGSRSVEFKNGVPAKVSIPFQLKAAADYPLRAASMAIGTFPVGTKVTVSDVKIVKITK